MDVNSVSIMSVLLAYRTHAWNKALVDHPQTATPIVGTCESQWASFCGCGTDPLFDAAPTVLKTPGVIFWRSKVACNAASCQVSTWHSIWSDKMTDFSDLRRGKKKFFKKKIQKRRISDRKGNCPAYNCLPVGWYWQRQLPRNWP